MEEYKVEDMHTRAQDRILRLWVSQITCNVSRDPTKTVMLFLDGASLLIADQLDRETQAIFNALCAHNDICCVTSP